jgi:predicted outer membrane repeat protein
MDARAIKKRVFYVDANATGANDGTCWEDAFTDLQDALDEAHGCYGCEVWVAKGTYKPSSETYAGEPQSQTFRITEGVMMYGGFDGTETVRSERDWIKNETILSGDIDDDGLDADNAWHVVYSCYSWISPTAGIDGFTITGGYADGQHPENNGGGIYIHGGGENHPSPTIANCKIINNYADISGAGMLMEHGGPTVVNCGFIGNSSGDGGGVACWSANLMLTNSMFSGNSAISDGGAIACADSNMIVTNCTFAQNSADFKGGGIFCGINSWVRVYNSILWDNTADFGNHWYNFGGSIVAHYSCVQGDWQDGDQTCINSNPLFVDANGPDGITGTEDDNLRLKANSPCIDAGDANYPDPNYPTDLDGRNRTVDGDCNDTDIVDMGAFEFTSAYYGDFDGDCDVEFIDYSILADFWMTDEFSVDIAPTPAGNGIIDANDLAILCDNWLYGK